MSRYRKHRRHKKLSLNSICAILSVILGAGIFVLINYTDNQQELMSAKIQDENDKIYLDKQRKTEQTEQVDQNEITVSTAQELKNAIDSIATSVANNKATKNNPYTIYLNSGNYELYPVLNLSDIKDQEVFKRGLEIPDYVNLVGIKNVTVSCTLPNTEIASHVQAISVINTYGENNFKNITFVAKNCRYCVHDDGGGAYKNRTIEFENCKFYHNGNDIGSWVARDCYGAGYTGGRKGIFKNCYFYSKDSIPFFVHNSAPYWSTDIFTLDIDDCHFVNGSDNTEASVRLDIAYETGIINKVSINNSHLNNYLYLTGSYAEFEVSGEGNNGFNISNSAGNNIYLNEQHTLIN